jgi:hypothetical protein
MALVPAPPPPSSPPPPSLQLGGLPYELAAAILLRLTPVERVLAERTCKGWLALLRAPALWAEVNVRDALRDLNAVAWLDSTGLPHLLRHAGASLRVVHDADGYFGWWGDALRAVFTHCPALAALRLPKHESASLAAATALLADAAALRRLRELDVSTVMLCVDFPPDAVRALLTAPLPARCEARGTLDLDLFMDADDGPAGAPAALAFAALLCECAWARLTLNLLACAAEVDAPTVAALLRDFVGALAPAAARRLRLRLHSALCAEQARAIARAVPRNARVEACIVTASVQQAGLLRDAFLPGVVLGSTLTLSGPSWPAADVRTAMDALRACALGADASMGETFRVSLRVEQPWSAQACEPLAAFLRSPHGASSVSSLHVVCADADALAVLLPALPAGLETLDLSRCAMCDDNFCALLAALRAHPALLLRMLSLPPLRDAAMLRRLCATLHDVRARLTHRDEMVVRYHIEWHAQHVDAAHAVACHAAMLRAPCACVCVFCGAEHALSERGDAAEMLLSAAAAPALRSRASGRAVLADARAASFAALRVAAAAVRRGDAPHVSVAHLAHILLAVVDDANGCDDAFAACAAAALRAADGGGVAALLRDLPPLLPYDNGGGFVAALLHALLRGARAAALPAAVMRDVSEGCAAGLRRVAFLRPSTSQSAYALLSWLLACQLAGITAARDAESPQLAWWVRRAPQHAHHGALTLAALLRGAAAGSVSSHAARLAAQQPQEEEEEEACPPHELRWPLRDAVACVHAACAVAPQMLAAAPMRLRTDLKALCDIHAARFRDAMCCPDDLLRRDASVRRCARAYALILDAALRADDAADGALQLACLRPEREQLQALMDAFRLHNTDGDSDDDVDADDDDDDDDEDDSSSSDCGE